MLPEDAILLPEIVDAIFLVAIHPASQGQHEEVQSVGHGRRLHGSDTAVTHVVSGIHSRRPFSRTIRHHGAARGGVGAQLVGDQPARDTALGFQQISKESDGCSPIPVRLHEDVQDVTVLVYCAPQILLATLDRDEHLLEMPSVSHPTAPAPQLPGVDRTEPLAPLPNRLVGDRHASLREEIFSIAEAETESIVEPDRDADDVGWESISVIAGRLTPHRPTLPLVAST